MNLSTYANRFDIAMIKNKGKIYVNTANGVSIIYLFNHFFPNSWLSLNQTEPQTIKIMYVCIYLFIYLCIHSFIVKYKVIISYVLIRNKCICN